MTLLKTAFQPIVKAFPLYFPKVESPSPHAGDVIRAFTKATIKMKRAWATQAASSSHGAPTPLQ